MFDNYPNKKRNFVATVLSMVFTGTGLLLLSGEVGPEALLLLIVASVIGGVVAAHYTFDDYTPD
jgi:hypothetical protein